MKIDDSMNRQTKEFMLDTGVFHSLTKPQVQQLLRNKRYVQLTASIVVPFELVSGIPEREAPSSEKEFRLRKAALSKYERLVGTEGTYWDEPHILKTRAFGVKVSTQVPSSFQILVKACAECESIDEVEAIITEARSLSSSMPSLNWLRQQSDAVSEGFSKSFEVGMKLVQEVTKSQLPRDKKRKISPRERKKLVRDLVPYLHDIGDLKMYVFLALAEDAGAWNGNLPSSELYEACTEIAQELRACYDGSLDLYIDAFASYYTEKWLDGGGPHRNDSFDLDHILYLRKEDANQLLVTTDNSLARRCLRTAPGRAVNINEFLSRVGESSGQSGAT